jgi:type VI secretion system protein ImpA
MSIVDVDALLQPVADEAPCGPNLEYDPAFLELEQAALGKPEVQYGDTITPAAPPEWKQVKKLALALLERSRDLRVATPLLRAVLDLHGPAGFADAIRLIERLLEERWDSLHPQLDPDDGNDPMLRINSLAVLTDAGTVLRELKEAVLIQMPGLGPLTLRILEVASGEAPAAEGQSALALSSIEAALRDVPPEQLQQATAALVDAHASAANIEVLLVRQVGSSQSLNLDPLTRVLARARDFLLAAGPADEAAAEAETAGAPGAAGAAPRSAISGDINSREDVLRMLDKIVAYYARNEPSSPVPLLLERAKRLVPKNFFEIMEDLAPDGMAQLTVISGQQREDSSY